MLTVTEAAKRLGVHPHTLRRWSDDGKVPTVKLPSGYRRFDPDVLAEWMGDHGYTEPRPARPNTSEDA